MDSGWGRRVLAHHMTLALFLSRNLEVDISCQRLRTWSMGMYEKLAGDAIMDQSTRGCVHPNAPFQVPDVLRILTSDRT